MNRLVDVLVSLFIFILFLPVFVIILLLGYFDTGAPVFKQTRVGKYQQPFVLLKFRTMDVATKSVASHLANTASITKLGAFLRKSKLDELPQLLNVLKGDMSLVGPRPNLYNQEELIQERAQRHVYDVKPGITGLAQINNIDMSTPKLLAETDAKMVSEFSFKNYIRFLLLTFIGKGKGDAVK